MSVTPFEAITLLVAFGVGLPAALRSPVAMVLFAWWVIQQAAWELFGPMPGLVYFAFDLVAFVAIAALAAGYAELVVLALFGTTFMAHLLYAGGSMDEWTNWAVAWVVGNLQFLIAGAGARKYRCWSDALERREPFRDDVRREFRRLWGSDKSPAQRV